MTHDRQGLVLELVCCELLRAKKVVARDARLRWDLIGLNSEYTTPEWFLLSHIAAA